MKSFFKPQEEGAHTPYLKAQGAFNEMYATHYNAHRFWRRMAVGAWVVAAIAVGGVVAMGIQHKVVPYAVEFNDHGEAVRISRADEMAQPNDKQIRAALGKLVEGIRTVYVDRRAQDVLMKTATAMVLPNSAAYQTFADYIQANNPYILSERMTVEVVVNSVRSISDKTWLAEWTETRRDRSGRPIDTRVWHGSFTVAIVPPTSESVIRVNPIGLYVVQFSWGEKQ